MRIDTSGNLTINSSGTIPTGVLLGKQLVVGSSTGSEIIAFREDTSVAVGDKVGAFLIGNSDTDGAEDHFVGMWGKVSSTNGSQDLHFAAGRSGYEGDVPHMTLDSSGQVGIGVSPSEALHIEYNTVFGGDNYIHMRKTDQGAGQGVFIGIPTASNNLRIMNHANNGITFHTQTSDTERMRIDPSGNVGIGVQNCVSHLSIGNPSADGTIDYTKGITFVDTLTSPTDAWVHAAIVTTGSTGFNGNLIFATDGDGNQDNDTSGLSEKMRIDSSGNLLVGTTSTTVGGATSGYGFRVDGANGIVQAAASGNTSAIFNRTSSDGAIVSLRKNGSAVGSINVEGSELAIGHTTAGLQFLGSEARIRPFNISNNAATDNTIDLGRSNSRFNDIYATNGTINTSDRNEKQDIAELSDAETRVAVAAKGLLRKFRWKSAVEEKGDEARIHFGIIAQDLQDAFTAEGLDAGDYAMFISDTWTDEDGVEQTRLGVRYSELLAFIIAAI